jgi:CelD/BcsL family acetyltransferase involved in cellulose biosynthesis
LAGGVSDYHDVLVDPAFADAAFAKLFELLYESRGTWDECDFEQLGTWSTLRAQPVPSAFVDSHHEEDPCPVLELPSFPVPLSAVVPSKQLARLAKYRRRAERQGTLALREGNFDDLAHLFRLHQARWQQKGLPGVLGENRLQTFHQDVVRRIGFEHARMYCLDFDGEPIAAIYALITRSVLHCYLQGFDPVFGSLSPGLLVVGGVLERAHESGFTAVDFLRGEEPYKTMWGARGAPNTRRRLRLRSS